MQEPNVVLHLIVLRNLGARPWASSAKFTSSPRSTNQSSAAPTGINADRLIFEIGPPTSLASSVSLPRSSLSQHEFSRALHFLGQHDSATKLC